MVNSCSVFIIGFVFREDFEYVLVYIIKRYTLCISVEIVLRYSEREVELSVLRGSSVVFFSFKVL